MADKTELKTKKDILVLLEKIDKEFILNTPYDPLYVAGVKRTLKWFINEWDEPIVNSESAFICSNCGTDLLAKMRDNNMGICLNCKQISILDEEEKPA